MENLRFPAGFRFHPSDEELIVHYLQSQATSCPLPAPIIAEIDLYKYSPWELPKMALFGEGEWYFFSPRDRKYPKGERPNRAAGLGYWKATGIDKPIFSSSGLSKPIGVKKGLAFYAGRPPKGEKTDWFMNEYRLLNSSVKPPGEEGSMRLDNWVLCRVRYRGSVSKSTHETPASHSLQGLKPPPKAEQRINTIVDIDSLEVFKPSPKHDERIHTSVNPDMITDYLHKGCVLLAFILSSGQDDLPRMTVPGANYPEATRNGRTPNSFYENSFDTSHLLLPMGNNSFNLTNGEISETGTLDETVPMESFVEFQGIEELDMTVNTRDTRAAYPQ